MKTSISVTYNECRDTFSSLACLLHTYQVKKKKERIRQLMSILYNASQLVMPSCTKLLAFSVNTKMNRGLLNVHTI